jgi:tripartite-type tricarboxylate transporter receptor subunit TctC
MITRRTFLSAAAGMAAAVPVRAQAIYPDKVIKMIVPAPAGGQTDVLARLLAQKIQAAVGQNVIIDNRPGAGGALGARALAAAEPDGYTLFYGNTSTLAVIPAVSKNPGYDPAKNFAPIASVSDSYMILVVHPSFPAKTVQEFVAYAKANPGKLHNGAGVASPPHIAWALFTITTGTDIVFVPYRGMAQAMTDLVAGQIQMMIDGIGSLLPHIRDGKARALAVTGARRSADLPDVPTMIESGYPDYLLTFWTGILAPAGTPPDIVGKLNAAINEGLSSAEMKQSLARFNVEPNIAPPREFSTFVAAEARKWADIVKATGIKVE